MVGDSDNVFEYALTWLYAWTFSPRGGRFCLLDVELFGAVIGCKLLLLFVGALCVEVRDAVQGRGMRVRAIY